LQDTPLVIWERADGQQDGLSLWQTVNGGVGLYAYLNNTSGGGPAMAAVGGVFAANVWVHVALTYDKVSGWARLYRNGVLAAEQNLGVFMVQTTLPLELGARRRDNLYYQGSLDEISLYKRPLTMGEVAAIYAAGATGKNPADDNLPPVANAGPDVQVFTAGGTATLAGTVSDDGKPLGGTLAAQWSKVDGPGTVTFANASAATTTATFSAAGTYVLRLDANDGFNRANGDTLVVRVAQTGIFEADASLAAWWPANGDPREVIRGGHDVEFYQGMNYGTGQVAQAFVLDGVNDHGRIAAHADLDLGSSAAGFTIELWAKPGRVQDAPLLIWERADGQQDGLSLWQVNGGVGLYAYLNNTSGGGPSIAAEGVFAANVWVHVALTYDKVSGWARLYRNGVLAAEQNLGVFTVQTTLPLELGARRRDNRYYEGALDEISLYTRPLTIAEIGAIYAAGATGKNPPDDNQPFYLNAGPNVIVASTVTPASLAGIAVDDGRPLPLALAWTKRDGPGNVTFADATQAATTATFDAVGLYTLMLEGTDGVFRGADEVQVWVGTPTPANGPTGLVAWWPGNGSGIEAVTGRNNVQLLNGADYAPGRVAGGFRFDGIDDQARIPSYPEIDVGASVQGFTIEIWAKPDVATYGPMLNWHNGSVDGLHFWTNNGGNRVTAYLVGPGGGSVDAPGVLEVGVWQHFTLTYDKVAGVAKIYKNGVEVGSSNIGTGYRARTDYDLYFGRSPVNLNYFDGGLDEISLYNRPLSAAEITAIYTAGAAGKTLAVGNTSPLIAFNSPASGSASEVNAPITLNARAVDPDGTVAKVEFFDGTTKLGETLTADSGQPTSFSFVLSAGFAVIGRHELTARVTDNSGAGVMSGLVVVNVAPVLPVVALTSPAQQANVPVGVAVTLQATATYALGAVAKVEFYDGPAKLGESTAPTSGSTYALTVPSGFGSGTHTLTAKAIAADTAVATSVPVSITATSIVPTVALTNPVANSALLADLATTLRADATYTAGPITKVEFYDGATKVGEATALDPSTTSTYSTVLAAGLTSGPHTLSAKVLAADGAAAVSATVPVVVALAAPTVALNSPTNNARVVTGAPLTLVATATQAVGTIAKVEFFDGTTKLGERTSADSGHPSSYTFVANAGLTAGAHALTAKATASNTAATTSAVVLVTAVTYNGPPVAEISAPAPDARLSAPTAVTGVVAHSLLASWALDYRLKASEGAAGEPWLTLSTGSNLVGTPANGPTPAVPGALGTFDPTLLINGIYELRLRVTDTNATTLVDGPLTLVVEGNMKVGAFTLAFEDLKVPVAGIPITLTRTYDSRDVRVGDFGPGWRLALANIRVQKNRNLGAGWYQTPQSGSGLQFYNVDPIGDRIVTVVMPDGESHRFKLGAYVKNRPGDPDNASFAVVVTQGQLRFYPLGDTTSKLEPLDTTNQLADHFYIGGTGDQDITAEDPGSNPFASPYNTTRFRLTTSDGTAFILDEALGLLSMTDLSGNTLVLGRDPQNRVTGVTSTQNAPGGPVVSTITIVRDATGRVDYIRDPANRDLDYIYDASGRLASFTNRELNVTQFRYENASFPNYLTKIIDPARRRGPPHRIRHRRTHGETDRCRRQRDALHARHQRHGPLRESEGPPRPRDHLLLRRPRQRHPEGRSARRADKLLLLARQRPREDRDRPLQQREIDGLRRRGQRPRADRRRQRGGRPGRAHHGPHYAHHLQRPQRAYPDNRPGRARADVYLPRGYEQPPHAHARRRSRQPRGRRQDHLHL
jgi:hypothetical protein